MDGYLVKLRLKTTGKVNILCHPLQLGVMLGKVICSKSAAWQFSHFKETI